MTCFQKCRFAKPSDLVVDPGLCNDGTVEEPCMCHHKVQEFAILKHLDCELEASELKVVCICVCDYCAYVCVTRDGVLISTELLKP